MLLPYLGIRGIATLSVGSIFDLRSLPIIAISGPGAQYRVIVSWTRRWHACLKKMRVARGCQSPARF
jgi:hypothetical protein